MLADETIRRGGVVAARVAGPQSGRCRGDFPARSAQLVLRDSSFVLTSEVAKETSWGSKEIAALQDRLAKLATKTWPLTLSSLERPRQPDELLLAFGHSAHLYQDERRVVPSRKRSSVNQGLPLARRALQSVAKEKAGRAFARERRNKDAERRKGFCHSRRCMSRPKLQILEGTESNRRTRRVCMLA